ncbi:MAG: hypothetical protein IPL39_01055 [Opitutaceae bacterium]|nr:hypothetical protein [Opitutaceae bacterium]
MADLMRSATKMRESRKRYFIGIAVVVTAILIGAALFPNYAAPRIRSPRHEIYNCLRQIVGCGEQYLAETGASEISFAEIVKLDSFPKSLPCLDEADYTSIVVTRGRRSYIVHSGKLGDIELKLTTDAIKWPNQRPEANAGKESVSPTTPGPGVAHP